MSPRIVAGAALALALSSTACSKIAEKVLSRNKDGGTSGSSGALSALPTPQWKESEVTLVGSKAVGNFYFTGTKVSATFRDLPPGVPVTGGGQKTTASATGQASLAVDVADKLAKLPPRDALDYKFKFDPQVKIEIDFGAPGKLALDAPGASVSYAVGEIFKKAADAPLPFPITAGPKAHTILFVGTSSEAFGPAATIDAIDRVALVTNLPERSGRTCDGYKSSKTKDSAATKSFVVELVDQKVTLYDARTQKAIANKTFKAKDTCPMMAFGGSAKSYASNDEMKAWVREMKDK